MTLVRAGLLAFALAACAWFALGIVQARATDQATAALSAQRPLSPGEAAHVRSLLGTAGTLNPDQTVAILRARLDALQGDPGAAVRTLESVVAREPDNFDAWLVLAQTALHHDARALLRAAKQIALLDPRLG